MDAHWLHCELRGRNRRRGKGFHLCGSAALGVWCDSTGRAGLKFASLREFDRFQLHRCITETQIN